MHHTANEIVIQGDPDRIYALAAAVEEWPAFLPHYRWVRVRAREGNRRTVEMAAWRPLGPWTGMALNPGRRSPQGFPVHWISHQWLWPEERRITFRHIGGLSRGMEVEWRIEAAAEGRGDGGTIRVTITHALRLEVPVVRSRLGQWIMGEWFVRAVAGRTLACLKQRIEGEL